MSVHFREFYEKDGKMNPGKGIFSQIFCSQEKQLNLIFDSGINISPEQFDMVISMADQIRDAIKDVSSSK